MTNLYIVKNTLLIWVILLVGCGNTPKKDGPKPLAEQIREAQGLPIRTGADQTDSYLWLLKDKKVALVGNPTSVIQNKQGGYTHLVDSLLSHGVALQKVFAPEHGFRGEADAGESVADSKDTKTGLPIISLHGKNRKPPQAALEGIELVVFDIQDVGVRFYTYIATLQLTMEACAEKGIPILVLDRPNPNATYVDGPTMEEEHQGFLGMTPIPLVYGMTIGEYAQMINGEGWLEGGREAELTVVPLQHYDHSRSYSLPIKPSPNLPNDQAVGLYPSLGLFEGTTANAGRGTAFQFQRYGASFLDSTQYDFQYTPKPMPGAKYPKEEGKTCFGKDLAQVDIPQQVDLQWLIDAYTHSIDKENFFLTSGFTKHAGNETLQQQIIDGMSAQEIRATWQDDIAAFRKVRAKYLLYE